LHRFDRQLTALAALLLLFAQLGAVSHAHAHDTAVGHPAAHEQGFDTHEACNDCLAYAPLLATAGAPAGLPPVEKQGRGTASCVTVTSLVEPTPIVAFSPRGPPLTP